MVKTLRTADVFVPGRNPRHTYNPRAERELEEQLRLYLDDGGAILALVGPTKTGKTVLARKVIDDPVWIESQGISSAEAFWAQVANELGLFVDATTSSESADTTTATLEGNAGFVKGGGSQAFTSGDSNSKTAVRLTSAEARRRLQESGRVLVVDDFHFIDRAVQKELIQALKPLVFNDVRIIFIAISHRVHDVPRAVEDMVGRSEPMEIDLWKKAELGAIAALGFDSLAVVDHGSTLAEKLAENSFGSPHLMQKLCRELVRGVNRIAERSDPASDLHAPADWDAFFRDQVEDYAGQWFVRLLNGPMRRGNDRNEYQLGDGRSVDGYGLILVAVASLLPKLTVTRQELNEAISAAVNQGAQPEPHQVTRFLKHMTRIAAQNLEEEVLPEDVLDDEETGGVYLYAGVEPVVEYVEDGAASTFTVADPFFAYYLRWGARAHI